MMGWFNALSLRWKLATVTIAAALMTIVLTAAVMGLYNARSYEAQETAVAKSAGKVIAGSVAATLDFSDKAAASEYLANLAEDPAVEAAAVYNEEGALFAFYVRRGLSTSTIPAEPGVGGAVFKGSELVVTVPVIQAGRNIGTVYLRRHVDSLITRFSIYAATLLGIGALSFSLLLPISLRIQRAISNPIEELAARNAIIRATLDSVEHGVIVVNASTEVSFINERALDIYKVFLPGGVHEGVNLEQKMAALETNDYVQELQRDVEIQRLKSTESSKGTYMMPDGRALEYRQSPLPNGGFVRTLTDITEEKALQNQLADAKQKAENAAVAKSQFLAAMSHEIRTPMNGVIGIVELLRTTPLSDEQKQMVEIIRSSGVSLLDVINDILDYSKIEAGRMTIEKIEFGLGEVIESTASVVGGHTSSKFIDIVSFVDPEIDHLVMGDPVRIRQVILNLMGNAIKFTQRGFVSIEASLASKTDDKVEVLIEITDTGIGIPEDKQSQLFKPFMQVDYSTTRKFGGTGLGLSITQNLVGLMGGALGVRSQEGLGSTFWVKIPFGRVPESLSTSGVKHDELKGLRTLTYDPVRPRSAIASYLRAAGATVTEVKGAHEITPLLQRTQESLPFDIAVFNSPLGDDSVFRTLNEMKNIPGLKVPRIVIATPHFSATSAKIKTFPLVSATVPAPISRPQLVETVSAVAGRTGAGRVEHATTEVLSTWSPPTIAEAVKGGGLILVAEDNQTNQFVIKSQLQKLGFAAEFTSDGREAWEAIERNPGRYGMLLTDCHMPYVDGYQLTGMIRDRELTRGGHMPIAALTANAQADQAEVCRAAGMDAYLFKPTNLNTLDATIRKFLPAAVELRRSPSGGSKSEIATASLSPATDVNPAPHLSANSADLDGIEPTVDLRILAELLGTADEATLSDMMTMFWENEADTPQRLAELLAKRDGSALSKAAHSAKGSAASLGATRLSALCKELEHTAHDENWTQLAKLVADISVAFEDVHVFIKQRQKAAA